MKKNDTKRFFLLTVGIIMTWCTCGVLKAGNTYMVIGSDVVGLDGIYTQNGTDNSKPVYSNPASFNLRYKDCTNKWVITDNSSCPYYSTYTDGNVPSTEGWHSGGKSQTYFTRSVIVLPENSLGYDKKFFVESLANDGSFNDTIRIALYADGNNFTGHKGDDYVTAKKVTISKLPSGLTIKVIKTSDTTLIAILSGKAYSHEYVNNINNLGITFNDIAFAQRNAANINGYNCNNINVLFQDRLFVSGANNFGVNDTFNLYGLYNEKPMYVSSNNYAIIYRGCKDGSQWAIINFHTTRSSGCSVYATRVVSNTIPLGSGKWFDNRGNGTDEIIVTSGNAVYLSGNFNETDANDGSVDSITINYAFPKGDNKFSGDDGDDFVAGGKVSVTNVPLGLTASIIRLDSVNLKFKLIGNATKHTSANSVSNLKITLNSSAFAKGSAAVGNIIHDAIQVNFKVDSLLVLGATTDASANGWYVPYGTYNGRTAYSNGSRWLWYRGCTVKWKITTNKESGCAVYSTMTESMEVPSTGWYKGRVTGSGNYSEPLTIISKNSISFDKKSFTESKTEAGVLDSINISYIDISKDNKFSGNNGDDLVTTGKITVSNVPAGLTASIIRMDSVTLKFKFLGKATNNNFTNSISNLAITFNNTAFESGNASEITGIKDTLKVAYLVDSFYVAGAISNNNVNGWYKPNGTFNGKPSYTNGNCWIWYKNCNSGAKWKINTSVNSGCPYYSTKKDDEILPLLGWNIGGHGNGKSQPLSFYLPNSIYVDNNLFVESKEAAGTTNDSANIYFLAPIDGNTFSGANGEDFVTTGKVSLAKVPVGLTASVVRVDSVTLKLKLLGTATNHSFLASVNDISLTINNTAFAKGNTNNIAHLKTDSLKVTFLPDSFKVFGATSYPDANGWYTMKGLFNNKPYYTNGIYYIGNRNCNSRTNASKWVLASSFARLNTRSCPPYSTASDSSFAPVAGWYYGGEGGQSKTEPIVILYPNSVATDKKTITESATAGVIKDTMIIYYLPTEGNAFSGANGDNFVGSGKALVKNLPAGLTAKIIRTSDTSLVVYYEGKALYNKLNDGISNLSIELTSSAFTKGNSIVKGCKITDISVVFYSKLMVIGSNAAVKGWYVIDGTNNNHVQFKKHGGTYYIRYKGCSNYTKWAINPGGCAVSKNPVDSKVPTLTNWTNGYYLLPENSLDYSKTKLKANFSGILNNDSIVVTLYRPDTAMLSGTNGDDFVAGGKLSLSNLPSGVTVKAIRTSDTTITLYFNGQILPTTYSVGIAFNSSAFSKIELTDVSFATINVTIAAPKTWTIASSGADFTSVADAVNSSDVEDGDMLKVSDGTYEINNLAIRKELIIKGNSPNRTTFKSTTNRMFYTPLSSYPAKVKTITFEGIGFNYSTSSNGVIEIYYAKANFNNCEFTNNQRVIYVSHGRLNVNNCTFANNSSYSNGTAIYINGDNNDTTNIYNSTFYGNKASGSGGAIYSTSDVFSAMNCTFVADTTYNSGGAIYRSSNSNVSITNCLFAKNNSSSIAGNAYNINYCLFDNAQTISSGANNITNSATVNVDVLTANGGSTSTCALLTGSSAINSGTNVNAPVKDQRGVEIAESTRDIGAFEYREVD
ncbi:MAG TPA: right-handed parallel beta-helix repeat-containing protein [Bacteroidales bacterium]|nr:right-handed parallel beta-helix repeat-containing protein [Bacteroidales bacterium]